MQRTGAAFVPLGRAKTISGCWRIVVGLVPIAGLGCSSVERELGQLYVAEGPCTDCETPDDGATPEPEPVDPCTNGERNGDETDVDCGGACSACELDAGCLVDTDCEMGSCREGRCGYVATCRELSGENPGVDSGTHTVDPDGPGGRTPFDVFCDMTDGDAGWTRVAFEPAGAGGNGEQGALPFVGIEVGAPADIARAASAGNVGPLFRGRYTELRLEWGQHVLSFRTDAEIFDNQQSDSIPLSAITTNHSELKKWFDEGGGAVFCRAAADPASRPGDTSWAVKPADSLGTECGCSNIPWLDRGVFYGGVVPPNRCAKWGGGFSGVRDEKRQKGGLTSSTDLVIYIR